MKSLLEHVDHRPWPLPSRPWVIRMTWNDLLFIHWPLKPAAVRDKVPPQLELDLWEGEAWVAVTPFWMSGVGLRWLPPIPPFPEMNFRTYVVRHGRPGVFFFSLDATSRQAIWAARTFFHLPYYLSQMSASAPENGLHYSSRRVGGSRPAEFEARCRPRSEPRSWAKGGLERFLTERYCLYAVDGARLWRTEIHHLPWPLQVAEAEILANTVAHSQGIQLPATTPLLHFAKKLDVAVWWPVQSTTYTEQ